MSHGQPPHVQKIVPCECGSSDAYWHGPEDGLREYCCDRCWRIRIRQAPASGKKMPPRGQKRR